MEHPDRKRSKKNDGPTRDALVHILLAIWILRTVLHDPHAPLLEEEIRILIDALHGLATAV